MSAYVTIVQAEQRAGYTAWVHRGTIHSYGISGYDPRFWRLTARWAMSAGNAWIRRHERQRERDARREKRARILTGYEK